MVVFTPTFRSAKALSEFALGEFVIVEGDTERVIDRFTLNVNGESGRVSRSDASEPVIPFVAMSEEQKAAVTRTRK